MDSTGSATLSSALGDLSSGSNEAVEAEKERFIPFRVLGALDFALLEGGLDERVGLVEVETAPSGESGGVVETSLENVVIFFVQNGGGVIEHGACDVGRTGRKSTT